MKTPSGPLNWIRTHVWPLFHGLLGSLSDAYAVTHTTEDEYAATVMENKDELETTLSEFGCHRTPIAALKIRFDGNVSDGSWVRRGSTLADEQLHIVVHRLPNRDAVDVYAHTEDNWIRHPLLHLRKKSYSAEKGVSSIRSFLDAVETDGSGLEYEIVPRYRRDGRWMLYVIHLISPLIARKLHDLISDSGV